MSEKSKKILLIVAIVALIEFSGYGILASLFRLLFCKLMKIKILIPIFNDWESILKLLENINSEIINLDHEFMLQLMMHQL